MDLNLNYELILARLKAFGYQLLGLFVTSLIGFVATFLGSDVFVNLVNEHFGGTFIAAAIFFVATHAVDHLRNLQTLKLFGAAGMTRESVRQILK